MKRERISKTRKIYFAKLWARILLLLFALALYAYDKAAFSVLSGCRFFSEFSPLHIFWGLWMLDMLFQLIPVRAHISIGSQKQFSSLFRPIKEKISAESLKKYVKDTTAAAYKVMVVWVSLTAIIGALYFAGILEKAHLFLIAVFFYVCDLICVLIWCPFRLIMKNKCCTTCRIFNWDHLMMFSPFVFVCGFFTLSLFLFALLIWLVWEVCVFTYPERFWENSNMALRCSECTDKLCTQYCRRLHKK